MNTNHRFYPAAGLLAITLLFAGCSTVSSPTTDGFASRDLNTDQGVTRQEFTQFAQARFQKSDTDGNGQLTANELLTDYLARWTAADTNHDGVVSVDEHVAYWVGPEMAKNLKVEGVSKAHIELGNMHGQNDSNADGRISPEENRDYAISRFKAMSKDGQGITREDIEVTVHTLFSAMDSNKDGIVSLEEFTTYHIGSN